MGIDKDFLVKCEESPNVIMTKDISRQYENNGVCVYYGSDLKPCTIILSSKSENINKTLIHECIHTVLFNLYSNSSMEKLAHKLNKREDFINEFTNELDKIFKLIIEDSPKP